MRVKKDTNYVLNDIGSLGLRLLNDILLLTSMALKSAAEWMEKNKNGKNRREN